MTDKPILFSAPMIRALLDGRKTQTRRALKNVPDRPEANCHPKYEPKHPEPYLDAYCSNRPDKLNPRGMSENWCWWQVDDRQRLPTFKVLAKPGDCLWVREAFARVGDADDDIHACYDLRVPAYYRADAICHEYQRWRPSIHMPREFSRLTLIVTDVRVQRLWEITPADSIAEGCSAYANSVTIDCDTPDPRDDFISLWKSINGPDAWDANPYVAAYTFTVHKCNIDAMHGVI